MDFSAFGLYAATIVVYFFIFNILSWGLNIQFGYTGIPNFTYITFMAAGAYFAGVTSLPPHQPSISEYILGLSWSFPFTLLAGAVAAGLAGFVVGLITLTRLRSDYLAIVTFSLGFIAYDFVSSYHPLFNGFEGIFGVPEPLNNFLQLDLNTYLLFFVGLSGVIMLGLWFVANRIYASPLGRTLRAIREDIDVAEALGKPTWRFRMTALVIGCVFAGVAGGLTIEFVTAFNPSGWATPETFLIWTAVLLGGRANNLGAVLGSLLVPVLFIEATRFIPVPAQFPFLVESGRFVLVGALLILTLWFRPDGLLPERKRVYYELPLVDAKPLVTAQ